MNLEGVSREIWLYYLRGINFHFQLLPFNLWVLDRFAKIYGARNSLDTLETSFIYCRCFKVKYSTPQ